MYPRTEDLLTIRDGEPIDAELHARLLADPRASDELARIKALKSALGELPELRPGESVRSRIMAELCAVDRVQIGQRRRWLIFGLAASVAALAVSFLLPMRLVPTIDEEPTLVAANDSREAQTVATAAAAEPYAALVEESARLERILTVLPERARVMNVGTMGTIVGLEDQVALIDHQLTLGAATGLGGESRQALWRERVDVMNALVQVRYAQAQRVGY